MKHWILILFIFLFSCKKKINNTENDSSKDLKSIVKSSKDSLSTDFEKQELKGTIDFSSLVSGINNVKDTGGKHSDWMSNNNSNKLSRLFSTNKKNFTVKTNSYEYKGDCIFYIHLLKRKNENSIRTIIQAAQGEVTQGYIGERILIFAMKNSEEANFIDIPANWNHIGLKDELLRILYEKIDSDIIICHRTKPCEYKNLSK